MKRLKDIPLIWRFMLLPLMWMTILVFLGLAFFDLRQESIAQLEEMRGKTQERLESVVRLGNRLDEAYSNIYQLLIDAPGVLNEKELYRFSKPHLSELHEIEDALRQELSLVEEDPVMVSQLKELIGVLSETRLVATNAMLMSTVDFALVAEQVSIVTRHLGEANSQFLTVELLMHASLSRQMDEIGSNLIARTKDFSRVFTLASITALIITILLITRVLRGLRRSVLALSRITQSSSGGKNARVEVIGGNEINLLDRAIHEVDRSHRHLQDTRTDLETANFSLKESHDTIQQREIALSDVNKELKSKVEELNNAIRKQSEAEDALSRAQRMEAIGNLTGGMAHDFNNLLAVIQINLEMLKEEDIPSECERQIEAAIEATVLGASLTKSMLAFARQASLDPEVFNLNDVVRRTKSWAGRTLSAAIEMETTLPAGLWRIEADQSATESALLNLLLNARDAMPNGGKLTLETDNVRIGGLNSNEFDEEMLPGRYVMLSVSDTGTGIAPDILDRIFNPFFTTKPPGSGSGLGLSMIDGFLRQSGGCVRVHSKLGHGTTFKLYFKAMEGVSEHVAPDEVVESQIAPINGGKVFVVEDEPSLREVVVETLKKAGYSVRSAKSGDLAYDTLMQDVWADVLLTDIVMPGGLQGPDLAKKLREKWQNLPVIFMSGYASETALQEGDLQPEDILLMKPVRRKDLLEAIKRSVQRAEISVLSKDKLGAEF